MELQLSWKNWIDTRHDLIIANFGSKSSFVSLRSLEKFISFSRKSLAVLWKYLTSESGPLCRSPSIFLTFDTSIRPAHRAFSLIITSSHKALVLGSKSFGVRSSSIARTKFRTFRGLTPSLSAEDSPKGLCPIFWEFRTIWNAFETQLKYCGSTRSNKRVYSGSSSLGIDRNRSQMSDKWSLFLIPFRRDLTTSLTHKKTPSALLTISTVIDWAASGCWFESLWNEWCFVNLSFT